MSSSLIKLLGSQFGRHGEGDEEGNWIPVEISANQLASTVVGLYFANMQSAKSKEFTKVLIEFYEEMKKSFASSSSSSSSNPQTTTSMSSSSSNFPLSTFQVIIIPFDEIEKIVDLNQTSTPFLHFIGEGARVRQEFLIRKYGVHETPTLILMDGTSGDVINFQGKERIVQDPAGFPWRHSSCTDILTSSQLITSNFSSNGPPVAQRIELLKESIKGILFAAYWVRLTNGESFKIKYPPSRTFISSLISVYNSVRERGIKFEIIFVSSDRSKESFDRFFSQMPWLGISYEDEKGRNDLTALLNIKAIPTLVIMNSEDNIITVEGRTEVNEDLEGVDFPWHPKIIEELRDRHSSVLNSSISLIYFIGDSESAEDYDKAEGILHPIASQIIPELEEPFRPRFFIGTDAELSESLRLFIDLEETKALVLILDIPNFRYAYLQENIEDEKSVKDFLHKFLTSQLQYKYIQSRFI